MEIFVIAILLTIIAMLYSTVGHGGASGYVAILTLVSYPLIFIRQDALILNILVSGLAFVQFYRAGFFQLKKFLPLVIGSVPMAWLGGSMQLSSNTYHYALGILLFLPAIWFWISRNREEKVVRNMNIAVALPLGALLGFISGLTGIGGGVFLSPVLVLGRWENQKQTAAISAPFILINSLAGLAGSLKNTTQWDTHIGIFAAACFAGGFLGSLLGAWKFRPLLLKRGLAIVLFIASVKLILG
jgi:uncharacterized membrane protein YfcA